METERTLEIQLEQRPIEGDISVHIFTASAGMVGVCLTVIGLFRAHHLYLPRPALDQATSRARRARPGARERRAGEEDAVAEGVLRRRRVTPRGDERSAQPIGKE